MEEVTVVRVNLKMGGLLLAPPYGVLMGDALLFAAETERRFGPSAKNRTPDVWEPIELPVVQAESGWYHCSALYVPDAQWISKTKTEVKFQQGVNAEVFAGLTQSGKFKTAQNAFDAYHLPELYFYAEVLPNQIAHFDELVALLPHMYVGAKRQRGYGRIQSASKDVVDRTSAVWDGEQVMRPVPKSEADKNGWSGYQRAVTVIPPYFYTEKKVCIVRDFRFVWSESKTSQQATIEEHVVIR